MFFMDILTSYSPSVELEIISGNTIGTFKRATYKSTRQIGRCIMKRCYLCNAKVPFWSWRETVTRSEHGHKIQSKEHVCPDCSRKRNTPKSEETNSISPLLSDLLSDNMPILDAAIVEVFLLAKVGNQSSVFVLEEAIRFRYKSHGFKECEFLNLSEWDEFLNRNEWRQNDLYSTKNSKAELLRLARKKSCGKPLHSTSRSF